MDKIELQFLFQHSFKCIGLDQILLHSQVNQANFRETQQKFKPKGGEKKFFFQHIYSL